MKEIRRIFEMFQNISLTIDFQHIVEKEKKWGENKTNTHYTLWLITSGTVDITVDKKTFSAKENDVVIFYPGESYHAAAKGVPCSFIFLFFGLGTGNMIDAFKEANASGIYSGEVLHKQCKIYRKNFRSFVQGSSLEPVDMLSCLTDFMLLIKVLFTKAEFTAFNKKKKIITSQLIIDSLLYINEHCTEDLTVKDLAKRAGMSEKYYISMFHYNAAVSPKQYQIECRMKKAANLLMEGNKTIDRISQEVGYPDQYSFSKAFKKYFGEAPSSFRGTRH